MCLFSFLFRNIISCLDDLGFLAKQKSLTDKRSPVLADQGHYLIHIIFNWLKQTDLIVKSHHFLNFYFEILILYEVTKPGTVAIFYFLFSFFLYSSNFEGWRSEFEN